VSYLLSIRSAPAIATANAAVYCGVSSTTTPESVALTSFGVADNSAVATVDLDLEYLWMIWPAVLGPRAIIVGGLDQTGAFTAPTIQSIGGANYYVCRSNQRLTDTGLVLTLGAP
jgi:hypothetical protein